LNRKLKIAVLFGGATPEHDVSIVSAQQLMDAVDCTKYDVIPVYMDFENRLFTGPNLRNIDSFRPRPGNLSPISFFWGDQGPAYTIGNTAPEHRVDCILPIFHGAFGEDGRSQAYFELLGIPVTGFSASNSAIAMRKDATKALVKEHGVNVLPHVTVDREALITPKSVIATVREKIGFPAIVKPVNLGSSIGVGVAQSDEELVDLAGFVLAQDNLALIEPRVPNLVEYNIAVLRKDGRTFFSAIEKPKPASDLLDFREKYLSGDGSTKANFSPSEGMLSLTRDINPKLPAKMRKTIYSYAELAFGALGNKGAPRIDFLCDSKTGEIWFNEINTIPGSYGFFLWEAAPQNPLLFPQLIDHLITEARSTSLKSFDDPVPQDAYLLPR